LSLRRLRLVEGDADVTTVVFIGELAEPAQER
jgi:hypothetical protein